MSCRVLRCFAPVETVFVVDTGPWNMDSQVPVCRSHNEQLTAGASWRFTEERYLLMGTDIVGPGERRIVGSKLVRSVHQATNLVEGPPEVLTFTHVDLLGDDEQETSFFLGDEERERLRALVDRLNPQAGQERQ